MKVLLKKITLVIYSETLSKILDVIESRFIWMSVDENTDSHDCYITNAIIGKLSSKRSTPFFINHEEPKKCNH